MVNLLNRFWRRGRDSNPRYLSVRRFSRPVQSTTLPPLQKCIFRCRNVVSLFNECKGIAYFGIVQENCEKYFFCFSFCLMCFVHKRCNAICLSFLLAVTHGTCLVPALFLWINIFCKFALSKYLVWVTNKFENAKNIVCTLFLLRGNVLVRAGTGAWLR